MFDNIQTLIAILRDANGKIVGRTRLQKLSYLFKAAGLEDNLSFEYKHYGPFSEDLASAATIACLFDEIEEEERTTSWGGKYSIYSLSQELLNKNNVNPLRQKIAQLATQEDAVVLELAATALFLALEEHNPTPWNETAHRKPDKATPERLSKAKDFYEKLRAVEAPHPFPELN
jgi:uncharacterized protein